MTTFRSARSLPALALLAALSAGAGVLLHQGSSAVPAPPARDGARELGQAFRDVARKISPSVVGVLAVHEAGDSPARFHGGDPFQLPFGDPFRRFFDGEELPRRIPAPRLRGQGTGVIIGSDGVIATNNHVVAGAERIEVTFKDGKKLPAKVIGTDPETDLAVLRVEEKGLPAVELGDSTLLEPGDWVVAVGNPFGLDHTVTVGVVSATGRRGIGLVDPSYEDFIQTDAAINPGNSGGPLVNLDGQVIGINTAIRSSTGGSDGIGFAIPSATLKSVLPKLEKSGRIRRGWLGVTIQPLTEELARSFGAQQARGALVSEVRAGTPAEKAGLETGDVVLSVDEKDVAGPRELSEAIAALDPGSQARLVVLRDGVEKTFAVTLAARPDPDELRRVERPGRESERAAWGLSLGDVPRALARELELEGGALVREVVPGSPADDAGLQPGDVILSVGSHDVDSAAKCAELLREQGSGARLLLRSQDGGTRWLFLEKRASD